VYGTTTFMVHFPNLDINTKNLKDKDSWDFFISTTEEDNYDEYMKNIKHGLYKDEIEKVRNGKEVYLKKDRMVEILKTKENNK